MGGLSCIRKQPVKTVVRADTSAHSCVFCACVTATQGFLPEEWDAFIQDVLYPNYTGTVALFLGASTLYGLWKIGKISLPFLGTAPAEKQE